MASMSTDIKIPASQISGQIVCEVTVTGMRRWNARMRLALWCIRLAAFVAPFQMHVDTHFHEPQRW